MSAGAYDMSAVHQPSASSSLAGFQAELLRQKVVFEEELRAQKEDYQSQLDDALEKLQCREIDCRNLQAVVTILGRKLDALSSTVEAMQQQRAKELAAQRYPNSHANANAPSSSSAAAGFQRPRSGSVSSQVSSVAGGGGVSYSAFGRTASGAAVGSSGPPAPSSAQRRGTSSPMRRHLAADTNHNHNDGEAEGLRFSRNSTATSSVNGVGGGGSNVPPQHVAAKKHVVEPTCEPADGEAIAAASTATRAGAATTPNRTARASTPVGGIPTTVLAIPSPASSRVLASSHQPLPYTGGNGSVIGNAPINTNAHGNNNNLKPLQLSSSAAGMNTPRSGGISSGVRPPSPRSMSSVSAYRPIGSVEGGVGLRGPTPTKVSRVTPERLRRMQH